MSSQKDTSKKSEQFNIGDLVQYISHSDGDCAWVSSGSYGIVSKAGRRFEDQAVEVFWFEDESYCWIYTEFLKKILTDEAEWVNT